MITREFKLYLNAGVGVAPVINANQFDQDEEWIFTLLQSDGTVYTPSTGAIIGLKQDGTTILNAGTVNSAGQVVITETEQITAVPGSNLFEILIDGNTHGTANFVVFVERRPGDIDNPSESDISLFQEAITAAGNVTQFQADISALQTGLSQETQTRQAQDTSLASQIAQEASTRSQQDAVLQAEIDQIIAPSGEAPSAAEVQNARIGVDGTTYDTLGNAIRGQVSDLKNAIDANTGFDDITSFDDRGYYPCATIGYTVPESFTTSGNYGCMQISVKAGDRYKITGTGGESARLYAFANSSRTVVENAEANETATDKQIQAPVDGYLFINTLKANNRAVYKAYINGFSDYGLQWIDITDINPNGVYSGQTIGVQFAEKPTNQSATYGSQVVNVIKGEKIRITGKGATSYRLWAFTDVNRYIVSVSSGGITVNDLIITAPVDGFLYFQTDKTQTYKIETYSIADERKQIIVYPFDSIDNFYNKFRQAWNTRNCDVYIRSGTYTMTNAFVNALMNDSVPGVPIGNGCRYFFDPTARVVCDYTGENVNVKNTFSPFDSQNIGGDYEIHGLHLTAKNIKYAIHDESNSSIESTKHLYKNCTIICDNTALGTDGWNLSKCIGGGLGAYESVEIDNCIFETTNLNPEYLGADVSYHDPANGSVCDADIYIKSSWFKNSFRSASYVNVTGAKANIMINSCSFGISNSYGENHIVREWNNETR